MAILLGGNIILILCMADTMVITRECNRYTPILIQERISNELL